MRVLIVGAGAVGFHLAEKLCQEGHDVSVVERDGARIRGIGDRLDVMAIEGNGASARVLERAGIADCRMVIAVTDSDEMNIIVCMVAREYGVPVKVARIRNPDYTEEEAVLKLDRLGVDRVINPERATVSAMRSLMELPGAVEVADFAGGDIVLAGFDIRDEAPIAGRTLEEIPQFASEGVLIVAIERREGGRRRLLVPRGGDSVRSGDRTYFLVSRDLVPLILPMVQRRAEPVRKVVLYGASREGVMLAREAEEMRRQVLIIEPEEDRAERAAAELSGATVIRGDAVDVDVLTEAKVGEADFFVAAGDEDQSNLMAALMAKRAGADRVMTVVREPSHVPVVDGIGIGAVVNPRLVTVGEILRYVRSGPLLSLAQVGRGDAEAAEMMAVEGAPIAGRKLRDVKFPAGALVGAVIRGEKTIVPDGNTVISSGDKAIVFSLREVVPAVARLFGIAQGEG
ncbi:MAG: Trk system potassium transporter TrkA [Planctomycetota bacterium]|nr:Trk system potassium transporter TrkA [Planctomycetota bacterium]